jgi:RNA polymerase sigma factor (sigma-70 family)
MTRKEAFAYLATKYDEISELVYTIEDKYFKKKGHFHQDITQDLYLKIYEELEKVENNSTEINKFLDRFYNGKTFNLYKVIRNMYIDMLRKETKYKTLKKIHLENLAEDPVEVKMPKAKSINQKVNDYVETLYWFDRKVFNLYRYEFSFYTTEMSKKTKLSQSTIYRTVKRCKVKINDKLKKEYYGEK